jgi:hypothetical protein
MKLTEHRAYDKDANGDAISCLLWVHEDRPELVTAQLITEKEEVWLPPVPRADLGIMAKLLAEVHAQAAAKETAVKNRPGQVICVAWPALMLAALTPEESWKLVIFLFACVFMLLILGFTIDLYIELHREEQTILTKLKREAKLRSLRLPILQGQAEVAYRSAVKDLDDEDVDPISLYNEAKQWGDEP